MKIICVGRNYAKHIKELSNQTNEEPVIFLKPDSALLKQNKPFYHPEFSQNIHHEVEVVLKIGKNGKYIQEKFAHKYVSEVGLGIDFTARDLQSKLKEKGLPWEISKGFDQSAVISSFQPVADFEDLHDLHFRLEKNNEVVQKGHTADMIFPYEKVIAYVSQFFSLRMGDLIYTGTPEGVGKIAIGDQLKGFLGDKEMFAFEVN